MNTTPPRWRLGLLLSLCTALLWGVLPIVLKEVLRSLDPITLTGYRFTFAAAVLGLWLGPRRGLPDRRALRRWPLLLVASLGLLGNYLCYLFSLRHITPSAAQALIQLAPLLLLLGSVALLGESMSRLQWLGGAGLVAGLALFFNTRLAHLGGSAEFLRGVLWMLAASATWAAYALAQKQLLRALPAPAILLIIYVAAAALLLPLSQRAAWQALSPRALWLLVFCCANTVLAYGAFAEALRRWQASRVSAVLTLTPLITLGATHLSARLWPGAVSAEPGNALSYLGAVVLVAGSALTALSR